MVLEACRKVENNQCQVEVKKQDKKPAPTIVGPGWVPEDKYGFGSAPNLSRLEGGTKTYKAGDFDKKGRALFTDPNYKDLQPKALTNLRKQFALRYLGHDIGRGGIGGWGGDSVIGTKSDKAIFAIMKKEHLNYNQAVAWSMDTTYKKIGLGENGPFYNPATEAFDRKTPIWYGKPPKNPSLAWEAHTYSQFENQRKYGTKREYLENIWTESELPKLKKNGHSDKYINQIRCDFLESGSKFVHATDRASTLEGAKKIGEKRAAITEKETRYAWIKDKWTNEIYPALKKNGIHKEAILAIRDEVFGELAGPIYTANNQEEKAIAEEAFKKATHDYVIWTPYAKNEVA